MADPHSQALNLSHIIGGNIVGSEVARCRASHRPPLKLLVRFCRVQLSQKLSSTETQETGLTEIKLTSPYSPYNRAEYPSFQPLQRQRR